MSIENFKKVGDYYQGNNAHNESFDYFYHAQLKRRSIREFSDKWIPEKIIRQIIDIANHAPSGANKQPWHFAAVCSVEMKQKIRDAAEKEEYENYHGRMSQEWLDDLKVFGTHWEKPFLTQAPWLIVVFKKVYGIQNGKKTKHYYVNESVGIACGFLISAIHQAGLGCLTHTPSPMNFLERLLERPSNERAYLLLPVGYAHPDATVPNIEKRGLDDQLSLY